MGAPPRRGRRARVAVVAFASRSSMVRGRRAVPLEDPKSPKSLAVFGSESTSRPDGRSFVCTDLGLFGLRGYITGGSLVVRSTSLGTY